MRAFLEKYGIAIFVLIIIGMMITLASPIGTIIGNSIKSRIESFISSDNELELESELEPGLYDEDDNLMYDWDTLVNTYGIDMEKDYYDEETWESTEELDEGRYPGGILNTNEDLKDGVKLVIGNISRIGNDALDEVNLETIIINKDVQKIGYCSFLNAKSKSIKISNSVTEIGIGAFASCVQLEYINIPTSITTINDGTFCSCINLKQITIPNNVIKIGFDAFAGCSNLSIIVPNSVTTISSEAFQEVYCVCYNGDAEDPYNDNWGANNIHLNEDNDFYCDICKLQISGFENTNLDPGLYDENDNLVASWDELINVYGLNVEDEHIVQDNYNGNVFSNENLKEGVKLIVSDNVSSLGINAFRNCQTLKVVILPKSLEGVLSMNMFQDCVNLEYVHIPNTIKSIGSYAFYGCSKLRYITIPNSIEKVCFKAFENCTKLNSIVLPNSVKYLEQDAFLNCINLKSIVLSENIYMIDESTFDGCESLKEIVIPNSVKYIDDYVFNNCISLEKVVLSENLESIGYFTFAHCSSLEEIIIPDSVTHIGSNVFQKCTNLQSIKIPDGVTRIGTSAFYQCLKLESIFIPNSVTSIDSCSFKNCNYLRNIYYGGTQEQWNNISFAYDWNAKSPQITVHCTDGDIVIPAKK